MRRECGRRRSGRWGRRPCRARGGRLPRVLPTATFSAATTVLAPRDTLVLYTDGLTEAAVSRRSPPAPVPRWPTRRATRSVSPRPGPEAVGERRRSPTTALAGGALLSPPVIRRRIVTMGLRPERATSTLPRLSLGRARWPRRERAAAR
ncbi:SpoIIE family protein phosphatase [Streptomyces sp. MH13]|uniref:SpoIIE family protein phosphatase n=1 Tax=Streptomyces sp. MH13 TaxID=3417651 RepID=UPI003CE6B0A0